jgi:hypothetical protein
MFESAIEAAATAASTWTPEGGEPSNGRGCCRLCLHRYRQLLLNGPLRDLPHAVAHAAVVAVDDRISEQVEASVDELRWSTWIGLGEEQDHEFELEQRMRAAVGSLTMVALDELSKAEWRFADLRDRFTEPAVAAYLGTHRMTEVPWQWEL